MAIEHHFPKPHIFPKLHLTQNNTFFQKNKLHTQMKNISILNILLFLPQFIFSQNHINLLNKNSFDPASTLWYSAPAQKWEEAIPVGNGRLGAMVFGKYKEERIQLNEETYWSGGPYSTVVKDGFKVLPDIQKKVFEGKYLEAHNLFG